LAQALDGISSKAAFINVREDNLYHLSWLGIDFVSLKRSTLDIVTWLEKWENEPKATL
jgi:hypothetical protein